MRMTLPWQNRLSARLVLSLSALLCVVLLLGLGIMIRQQQRAMMQEETARAGFMAEGLLASLQTLMLTGHGPLARDWLDRVSKQPGVIKAQVIRRTGYEAFLDMKTIHQVNRYLDMQRFTRDALPTRKVDDISPKLFKQAVSGQKVSLLDEKPEHLTYLLPIKKLDACNACHGYDDSPIRGVLRITTSTIVSRMNIAEARNTSIAIGVTITLLLAAGLLLLVRHMVLRPVLALQSAAQRIDEGDLSARAPVESQDEIGRLGESFNHMSERLVEQLAQSETLTEYYHHLLDGLSNGVVVYTADGAITYVNERMPEITGFPDEEYKRIPYVELCPKAKDTRATNFQAYIAQCIGTSSKSYSKVMTRRKKDGSEWIARITLIPLYDDTGVLTEAIEISEDITEDQQRQEEIKWLSSLPEMNPFPIIEVDSLSSEIVYMNPATLDYLNTRGFAAGDIDSILPESFNAAVNICREKQVSIDTVSFQVGDEIMIWQLHPNETNDNVRAYAIDVTNQVCAEREALHLAQHDALTGLANRLLFFEHLKQAVTQAGRTQKNHAVLMVDLDHFKPINDKLGHDAGDEALREAARRMDTCLRETDTLARFGGDEFTILLTNLRDVSDAKKVAGNIIEALSKPMQIAGQTCTIGASIGIALSDNDVDASRSVGTTFESSPEGDRLLLEADIAMYAAKQAGRNDYRLYTDVAKKNSGKHVDV